jgi:hypothetical protein
MVTSHIYVGGYHPITHELENRTFKIKVWNSTKIQIAQFNKEINITKLAAEHKDMQLGPMRKVQ